MVIVVVIITKQKGVGCSLSIRTLPSKQEVLSSNSNTTKKTPPENS
jgi:hypothetical protein